MSLKKIKIYGKLRKFLGQASFMADVASPAEAIKFLLCNFPHLESHLYQHHYKIKMGEQDIPLDLLHLRGEEDIQIIPVVAGSGFIGAIFGAISAGAAAVATTAASIPVVGGIASAVAQSVVIDGVVGMLTPTPSIPTFSAADAFSQNDPQMQASSFAFSGIQNVSRSGVPVPIIYGERFVGSIIVSNGVDTIQVDGTA